MSSGASCSWDRGACGHYQLGSAQLGFELLGAHAGGKGRSPGREQHLGLRTIEAHTTSVTSVRFSPDSRHALSSGGDGALRLWLLDWEPDLRQETTLRGSAMIGDRQQPAPGCE